MLSSLLLFLALAAADPSTTTITMTTTIPRSGSSTPASTSAPPNYPSAGELATYAAGGSMISTPSVAGLTYYDGCPGSLNGYLPPGSSYVSTFYCYNPASTSKHPGSTGCVLSSPTNLLHMTGPASLAEIPTPSPGSITSSGADMAMSTSSPTPKPAPSNGPPINVPAAERCITTPGGVQGDGTVSVGCGAVLQHVTTCFDSLAPWTDPYDTNQSTSFQACLCETNATTPFGSDSMLWRNFTGCSSCLETFDSRISLDTLAQEFQNIENFCSSQNPVAFLALAEFKSWLGETNKGVDLKTPPLTGSITQLGAMRSAFTTTPPLANLAYGPSAPFDGTLAGVTPQLMTQTITVPPTGTETGSESLRMITMLVDWVPTAPASGTATSSYDAAAASASAASAASSNLQAAISSVTACHGPCLKGASAQRSTPSWLMWTCMVSWLMWMLVHGVW
ncbi:hypothetical protein LTR56_005588 [Elasticomyces elasticus]|nr:hypothetical protein LTR56_005588 [Elasticomyces elasticus]KAK3664024.1 hypothetical protein LTR22_005244 [Elasticomyces elasticus]KAK4927328.1 hypothetical protein LTR49_005733 [Elasticomyces elasticus]KAK5763294.1 hypothetical protein LTS12_006469 [Elasticomyces elasticus]